VGNRYAVDLTARRGESASGPGIARSLGDRAGYFALPFATGDAELPEVIVKMLQDGAFGTSGAPVFYASLTTLPYDLRVTDTRTGQVASYASNPDAPLCGGATLAFHETATVARPRTTTAPASGAVLALLQGRFSITLEARLPGSGRIVRGAVLAVGDGFGFFSLPEVTGDPQIPEVVVKMVDARSFTGNFWFFHTGLTSLDYTLTVVDSGTGAVRTYDRADAFCGAADIHAFTASPRAAAPDLSGAWMGTISFPSDCFDRCRPIEEIQATLSQTGDAVTGRLATECLGPIDLLGTLGGDQLSAQPFGCCYIREG
jgi:hypothetical protein